MGFRGGPGGLAFAASLGRAEQPGPSARLAGNLAGRNYHERPDAAGMAAAWPSPNATRHCDWTDVDVGAVDPFDRRQNRNAFSCLRLARDIGILSRLASAALSVRGCVCRS